MMKLIWMIIAAMIYSPLAYASDWYVNMGLGASMMQQTTQNGTWLQEGQPYKMNLLDLSGKLGMGSSNYPISKSFLVPMLTLKIPL